MSKMPSAKTIYKKTNRLINQTSPYLLQHAHNPVDWYPWSDEAFEEAKRQNKPVFLSIGYSTCHWCHVMERESFVDEVTAAILNEYFVSVKVDREERPDVDAVYMQAIQAMTGGGGWPLSVFLTPEGKPFYGGTYFPPNEIPGRPSFKRVLLAIADSWENKHSELLDSSEKINHVLRAIDKQSGSPNLSENILDKAKSNLENIFDEIHGGFGNAPKFPQPVNLSFLLRYWNRTSDAKALEMVLKTLDKMAEGGIYDHLGGGFHRYSTDIQWLIPHFEKMLYDQAQIAKVYIEAYQITKDKRYAKRATEIFDYVLRDMTDHNGGFYSAEDADSDDKEGVYYVWEHEEIERLLGNEEAKIFNEYYGATEKGNFEHGKNNLNVNESIENVTKKYCIDPNELEILLLRGRQKLLTQRRKRIRPYRDDKIIAGWNGLMISSLAFGGAVLNEPKYIRAAENASEFVLSTLQTDGRLKRYYRAGRAVGLGVLDDYAFLVAGLIDLYEADFNIRWLYEAKKLVLKMTKLFSNNDEGGLYLTGNDTKDLIARTQSAYDGAIPSGNSIAAVCLLKLGCLTMNQSFIEQAQRILEAYSAQLEKFPVSSCAMLSALDFWLGSTQEIVIAGDLKHRNTQQMINMVRNKYLPNSIKIYHGNDYDQKLYDIVPFVKNQIAIDNRPTAYICQDYVCNKPVNNISDLDELLKNLNGKAH